MRMVPLSTATMLSPGEPIRKMLSFAAYFCVRARANRASRSPLPSRRNRPHWASTARPLSARSRLPGWMRSAVAVCLMSASLWCQARIPAGTDSPSVKCNEISTGGTRAPASSHALVGDDPLARGALRRGDLLRGHLGRDLTAQPDRILVAAHGGEIEPLVRGDEVDREAISGRAVDAELEESAARIVAPRRHAAVQQAAKITLH